MLGMEDDKGIISESEDGNYVYDKHGPINQNKNESDDELSDISENS
jgi:hypothetical protein